MMRLALGGLAGWTVGHLASRWGFGGLNIDGTTPRREDIQRGCPKVHFKARLFSYLPTFSAASHSRPIIPSSISPGP